MGQSPFFMKNLILTTISDSRFSDFSSKPEVDVFLKSVAKVPNADLVIFGDVINRPIHHIQVEVRSNIIVDRWMFYYDFLCRNGSQYKNVLLTDAKDVLFQTDPFEYANDTVMLTGEGTTHAESIWNFEDQQNYQQKTARFSDPSRWPVVNGGIVMGPATPLKEFCVFMYTNTVNRAYQNEENAHSDQAVINGLYHFFLSKNPSFSLSDPRKDSFCITGNGVARNEVSFQTIFTGGVMLNEKGDPYSLFHQWDRTKYKDEIIRRFR
jgi:hypothetical protein